MKLKALTAIALLVACLHPAIATAEKKQAKAVQCEQRNGVVNVKFQDPSYSTRVTVLRPDGGMVFIASPKVRHDYRVQGIQAGGLSFSINDQMGEQFADDGLTHPRRVFDEPGTYTLLFSDGVTPQESTEPYSCKVNLAEDGVVSIVAAAIPVPCDIGSQLMAACHSSEGCSDKGAGYCCSNTGDDSPCYCNNCCVALTGLATQ